MSDAEIDEQPNDSAASETPVLQNPKPLNIAGMVNIGRIEPGASAIGLHIGQLTGTDIHFHVAPTPAPPDPAALAASQALLESLPLDRIPEPAALPPASRITLRRNPLFVGRADELRALARAMKAGETAAIGQIAAATGLGGIGKTQLATEFAHCYGQYFAGGIFWLNFADEHVVAAEIAACGRSDALALSLEFDQLKLDDQVRMVLTAWKSPLPRLLIFDNCEDEGLLEQWKPTTGGCRVLVTSRKSQWPPSLGVVTCTLAVLPRQESVALLRKFRPDLAEDHVDLHAIAAEVGDLPLALHLAGSYLARYRHAVTPAEYLTQLRSPALLDHRSMRLAGGSPTGHAQDVGRTFALSYERLDQHTPTDLLAQALLARACFFAPGEPIPHELLLTTVGPEDEDEQLQAEDALARLIDLGLIESADAGALKLHRLIVLFARTQANDEAQAAVEKTLIETTYELNEQGLPAHLQQIQPHLRYATSMAEERHDDAASNLCYALGNYLRIIGDYTGARFYFEAVLAIDQTLFEEDSYDIAADLNNLAYLLKEQGDYTAARPLMERTLAICERTLGPDHPDTATSLNNLAGLHLQEGDYAAAKTLLERALAICERTLGPDHPDTATSLNNLAELHRQESDYAVAQPLFERALASYEQTLGENHPNTAMSLNNLAELHRQTGNYTAARPLSERALAIYERVLGPDHPYTASSLGSLAELHRQTGDYAAAQPLLERVLTIYQQTLGENHPNTATSLNNLAELHRQTGNYAAARPLSERALEIKERVLGSDHPDTAYSLNNLALLHQEEGYYAAAWPLFERALAIFEHALGADHPNTATILNNLAGLHYMQGSYAAALPLFERALAIYERALGADHPNTATILNNLALLHQQEGEYTAAQPLFERTLAIYERALGPDHPDTATIRRSLAGSSAHELEPAQIDRGEENIPAPKQGRLTSLAAKVARWLHRE